jgi:tryptophan 2-C-methyltransferase
MLTLVNSNRIKPPIAPIGIDYVAAATRAAGIETNVLDLGLTTEDAATLQSHFSSNSPRLIGISFRNVDDCFWPSCKSYVQELEQLVRSLRRLSDAPIVLGGVGLSLFVERLVALSGADFGIHGDGEQALVALFEQLQCDRDWQKIPGLCWKQGELWVSNSPAWPDQLDSPRPRDAIDNREYYRRGGQGGIESKRGCPRRCIYCADPIAKGRKVRYRSADAVAEEAAVLCAQGVEVLHFCDGEFNVPRGHALAVCDAFIAHGLQEKLRFYIYAAVRPFDAELANKLKRAGCVGINFTGDSAHPDMLLSYRAAHRREHLAEAVRLCRSEGIACMVDLLLGGPGETPETITHTLRNLQSIGPDCVGAALGMRLYPGTLVVEQLLAQGSLDLNPGIKRRYTGAIDFVWPTFYVSPSLGDSPARLVRELIGTDDRFFPPIDESDPALANDHNYSDNTELGIAIENGARGAYWDLLRKKTRCL